MNEKPIPGDALGHRPGLQGNGLTGGVADCDDYFDAMEAKCLERVSGKHVDGSGSHSLPLARLTDPVAQVAESMFLVYGIESCRAKEQRTIKDTEIVCAAHGQIGSAQFDPGAGFDFGVRRCTPGHPSPHRFQGFVHGIDQRGYISVFEGAHQQTSGSNLWHGSRG